MMRTPLSRVIARASCCLLLAGLVAQAALGQGTETFYDGTYRLQPNGDMMTTRKYTMPMLQYQNLRQNVSNLYLLLRDTASARADTEVAEKKADYDDPNRTVIFTMTILGAAKNMGNHWEIPVAKGAMFSTFNEKENTFYFSEAGANVRGNTKGILPPGAMNPKWDESRRVITYSLSAPRTVISGPVMPLLIPGIAVTVVGLLLLILSFVGGNKRFPGWRPPLAPPMPGR
jgi:hypothetical protein